MKLENLVFDFDRFAAEMANLKEKKHFDYLVTIVGEDFGGEEGLGCIYILENTDTHERTSVKMLAKQVGEADFVIHTVSNIWKVADLLEREVFDFYGIKFFGHPDMRRLYLRNDFKGHPFRKDWQFDDSYSLAVASSKVSWTMPVRSRRSIKINPPRSRWRCTQPNTVSSCPTCSIRSSPQ